MPDDPMSIGFVLDCTDPDGLAQFWASALDYVNVGAAGAYVALIPNGRPGSKRLRIRVADGGVRVGGQ